MEIIKKSDERYPKRLLKIKNAPEKLYVEGDSSLLNKNAIAVVGSRKCTSYGWRQAKRIAEGLAQQNICVISGMAIGIDTAAHIGAKEQKGKTIAVLGSGLHNIYPKQNTQLYHQILEEGGCIISEHEPKEEVDMQKFPQRNRIISGISMGVVLIEAKYRSGSNITAKYAIKEHKPLFCIPSNLESINGYGPNKFIQQGASLIMSAQDILEELELTEEPKEAEDNIETKYQDIYEQIGNLPISANTICNITGKTIAQVNEALFILELQGVIKMLPGNQFIRSFK